MHTGLSLTWQIKISLLFPLASVEKRRFSFCLARDAINKYLITPTRHGGADIARLGSISLYEWRQNKLLRTEWKRQINTHSGCACDNSLFYQARNLRAAEQKPVLGSWLSSCAALADPLSSHIAACDLQPFCGAALIKRKTCVWHENKQQAPDELSLCIELNLVLGAPCWPAGRG